MYRVLEGFTLRWYGVEEYEMILERIGFEDIVISLDDRYGEYLTNSAQTIIFEVIDNK